MLGFLIYKNNKLSFLFGTAHNISIDQFPINLINFICSAKTLVTENMDSFSITKAKLLAAGLIKTNREPNWIDELSKDQIKLLELYLLEFSQNKKIQVNISELSLIGAYQIISICFNGYINGLDYSLIDYFQSHNKKILGLETLKDIKDYIAAECVDIKPEIIRDYLQYILTIDITEHELTKKKLAKFVYNLEALLEIDNGEVLARNRNWLPIVERYHYEEEPMVLFAVGFQHINGLNDLLIREGFVTIKFQDFTYKQSLKENYNSLTWMKDFNDKIYMEQWRNEYFNAYPFFSKNGYGPGAVLLIK